MKKEQRFEVIYRQGIVTDYKIVVDRVTGVNYLIYNSGEGTGLTPLLDAQGNVVVTSVASIATNRSY